MLSKKKLDPKTYIVGFHLYKIQKINMQTKLYLLANTFLNQDGELLCDKSLFAILYVFVLYF